MSQTIGARRGVGSVLTYRVFPGNKAGEKPWSHRKPYKPKSNRATSSKKTGSANSSRALPCPETKCSRRPGEARFALAAAAASLSSSNFTTGQTAYELLKLVY